MASEPRSVVVSIRFRPDEAAHIDAAGQAPRQPRGRADYCRAAVLHAARAKVPPPAKLVRHPARRLPALDLRLLGQILGAVGKVGGHSNQLAKVANSTGALPTIEAVAALVAEIAAVRQTLTAALRGDEPEGGA